MGGGSDVFGHFCKGSGFDGLWFAGFRLEKGQAVGGGEEGPPTSPPQLPPGTASRPACLDGRRCLPALPFFSYLCSVKRIARILVLIAALATLTVGCRTDEFVFPGKEPGQPEQQEQKPQGHPEPSALTGTAIGSGAWRGLDLGEAHVITKVSFESSNYQQLGLFEGANSADFSDALPIAMVKEKIKSGKIEINCSRGFRYVRYMAPPSSSYKLTSFEFEGWKGAGDDSHFCQITNLPTVVINTQNAQTVISKTNEIPCTVYIISNDGKDLLTAPLTGIRGRGNASWDFPKKPYRIKFAEKHSPLGAPSHDKRWTLINNYGDKTLMRNILAFEVSRRVGMAYTPFCVPVDMIMNSQYQGCYQFCDQVETGVARVPAKGGYLIEIDAYDYKEDIYFSSSRGIPVSVHYPKSDSITSAQRSFIKEYFNSMEAAVFSSSYTDATKGYRKYLDLDSFLRNFIVGEFCGNTDTYWSVYMYKDAAQGVLYTGPAWDYDLAFENDQRTAPINNLSDYIYASAGSVASSSVRSMVTRIVKNDSAAKARLLELWEQYKPALADLNDYVDATAALMDESQQLNFVRWPILNERVHQNVSALGSYSAEVNEVKKYITGRLKRFDQLVRR